MSAIAVGAVIGSGLEGGFGAIGGGPADRVENTRRAFAQAQL